MGNASKVTTNKASRAALETCAVVFNAPRELVLKRLTLEPPTGDEILVDVEWSGISTGTEKLLWQGRMPEFPGMGYPLVPGYESVGRISATGPTSQARIGTRVFVPGARCFGEIRGLFGGAASRLVVAENRVLPVASENGEEGILLALAATAYHALAVDGKIRAPDLIVGHGILGRLLARLTIALHGVAPTVWEIDTRRSDTDGTYKILQPRDDACRDYRCVVDVSGDAGILDAVMPHLAVQGEIVLAGFYSESVHFVFPPAFMREATVRIAAQWQRGDLAAVAKLVADKKLSLAGLITHRAPASDASVAYGTAFDDPGCLKMILDWRSAAC